MNLVVIYNYFEENREADTHINYALFIKYGYYESYNIDYIFIINGRCTMNLLERNNIKYYYRKNEGYDFGAYGDVLNSKNIKNKYDYYFFINSSVRGPFLPQYCKMKWYEPFLNLMKDNVKLVGSSINIFYHTPHVQSYAFMLDNESVNYLMDKIFDKIFHVFWDVVTNQEFGMSTAIINNGWKIDCLIPELNGVNWSDMYNDPKYIAFPYKQDLIYSGNLCNGRDLHPYELIFAKVNRNLNKDVIESLTKYLLSI